MSVFSKNAIISGCVDFYCLACETQLRSEEDCIQHIGKPIHKKNLDATGFLDKHRDDRVRKVKKGYFCEFCNLFMRTAAKVGPHVAEATHRENKVTRRLKREGNGVLAFDNVFIGENAWHGLVDNTCAVCDAEFDNALIHKTETWHVLNLVLYEIEIAPGDNIYRKIDESTFQCLTCNTVCALNTMTAHFEDTEHKKLYQECCDAAKTRLKKNDVTETVKDDKDEKPPENEVAKAAKEENAQKPEPEKTADKEPAKDDKSKKSENGSKKKTRKSPEIETANGETSKSEVEKKADKKPEGKQDEKVKESETGKNNKKPGKAANDGLGQNDSDICKGLKAVNYIARDVCGKQWCILCDWSMDDNAVEAHVKSRHHQTMFNMHKERTAQNQTNVPEVNEENPNENKNKILDSATDFQKNHIKLDMVDEGAYCRKCSNSIDFDFDVIKNHIDEHKKKATKPETPKEMKPFPTGTEQKTSTTLFTAPVHRNDAKKEKERECRSSSVASSREEDEVEAFAKQHNLTYSSSNNNAFCRLCVTKVPASIKNMKEHINGNSHKSKIAKIAVKTVNGPTMTSSYTFIDNVITIENMFSKDVVINEKFAVNILSFLMITKNGAKLRCQACEINVTASEIDSHKNTPKHERAMNETLVASSVENEFIREIRHNLFHCGYCNQLEATWATMESHLKSTAHREAKTAASWRLMEYAPMIANHRHQRRMQLEVFTRLLMGQMFGDE